MTQAIGALILLVGALMWHIASANLPHHNIQDIWADMTNLSKGNLNGGNR